MSDRETFQRFFEMSIDLLATASVSDGTWKRVNPAFERVLGWRAEELVGTRCLAIVDLSRSQADADALASGALGNFEHRVRCKDGSSRWIAWHTVASAEEDTLYCVGRDITEQRARDLEVRSISRRRDFLLKLSDQLRPLTDAREITAAAAEAACRHLGLAQVAYAQVNETGELAGALSGWSNGQVRDLVSGGYSLADFDSVSADLFDGRDVIVEDALADGRSLIPDSPVSDEALAPIRALAFIPLVKGGQLVACLVATHDEPRAWPKHDLQLLHGVAERTWAALEKARADAMLRKSHEHRRLLLSELQHRVRNTFAVVRSIAARTMEGAENVEEASELLRGRIDTLARLQTALTRTPGAEVDLEEVIRDELLATLASDEEHSIEGQEVLLSTKAAEVLTLAVHELATNSVRHGAIGQDGRLAIKWSVEPRDGEDWLTLVWSERGVRVVTDAPRRTGFGSELIEQRVPYELKGRGVLELRPGGIVATIEFPLRPAESILATAAQE